METTFRMTDQDAENDKLDLCLSNIPNPDTPDQAEKLNSIHLPSSSTSSEIVSYCDPCFSQVDIVPKLAAAELRPCFQKPDIERLSYVTANLLSGFHFSGIRNLASIPTSARSDCVRADMRYQSRVRRLTSDCDSWDRAFLSSKYLDRKFLSKGRQRSNRFRSSLAPIDEVIYQDVGIFITQSNKNRRLCEYVFRNEYNFVRTLLGLNVSPNCHDDLKRAPLHIAVSKGYCEMVQLLLDNGADPNMKDGLGNSCLHLAACTNNVEMALILIKGGASVHAVDIRGRSPIQLAQSKLKILQQCPDGFIKSKVEQVIDMLLLYLQKGPTKRENAEESELLSSFQNRLQITDSPEQISSKIDGLSKMLNQMETLTIK